MREASGFAVAREAARSVSGMNSLRLHCPKDVCRVRLTPKSRWEISADGRQAGVKEESFQGQDLMRAANRGFVRDPYNTFTIYSVERFPSHAVPACQVVHRH